MSVITAVKVLGFGTERVYFASPLIRVCTMRSAVLPSQRSGNVVCFHFPLSKIFILAESASGLSFTSSFVPMRHVSGCSAYELSVIQGTSRNVASSAILPESVMMPFAEFTRKPKCKYPCGGRMWKLGAFMSSALMAFCMYGWSGAIIGSPSDRSYHCRQKGL